MDENGNNEYIESDNNDVVSNNNDTAIDYSDTINDINSNLVTINSNITTTYNAIVSLQEENENTQNILNNCFGGVQLISSLNLLLIIGAFIVLCMKYIRRFL